MSLSASVCLSVSLSVFVYFSLSFSFYLCLHLSLFLPFSPCVFISLWSLAMGEITFRTAPWRGPLNEEPRSPAHSLWVSLEVDPSSADKTSGAMAPATSQDALSQNHQLTHWHLPDPLFAVLAEWAAHTVWPSRVQALKCTPGVSSMFSFSSRLPPLLFIHSTSFPKTVSPRIHGSHINRFKQRGSKTLRGNSQKFQKSTLEFAAGQQLFI